MCEPLFELRIFIRRGTDDVNKLANSIDLGSLRDPQPDADRRRTQEWLIVIGICTHLGCIPFAECWRFCGMVSSVPWSGPIQSRGTRLQLLGREQVIGHP
ncbi:hypothetical protein MLD38_013379 [Melastoma candidum]|uniref:Uncharacterized protein n=1 Tax=Melastoma candidum TaxID=119954 RepID=A0ACB9R9D1_9MYRT|nr:hypothetical protein MLD38_013379 [Melastoma candidum]